MVIWMHIQIRNPTEQHFLYAISNFDWLKVRALTDPCTAQLSRPILCLLWCVLPASLPYSSGMAAKDSDRWKQKLW
jgi:hypothetical protein